MILLNIHEAQMTKCSQTVIQLIICETGIILLLHSNLLNIHETVMM